MQELMQIYHSLYIRILSKYSNTYVTERIYELTEYLFQPYYITWAEGIFAICTHELEGVKPFTNFYLPIVYFEL